MSDSIIDLINSGNQEAQTAGASLLSYREYLASFKAKILTWFSDSDESASDDELLSLKLPRPNDLNGYLVGFLSRSEYRKVMDGSADVIDILINDANAATSTIQYNADAVAAALEEQISELNVQKEFVDYTINNAVTKATEFFSLIKTKFSDASNALIEKYSSILENNTGLGAIRTFLQTFSGVTPSQQGTGENVYIQVTNVSDYVGVSVWQLAWNQFTEQVSGFFDKVWQGIQDLGGFFQRLWDGVLKLGKWAIGKLFSNLTTVYDYDGHNLGIMDMPIMQCYLGYWDSTFSSFLLDNPFFSRFSELATIGGLMRVIPGTGMTCGCAVGDRLSWINGLASTLLERIPGDPNVYTRPCDVIVPIKSTWWPCSVVLRLGTDNSHRVILSVYLAPDKEYFASLEDDWARTKAVWTVLTELVGSSPLTSTLPFVLKSWYVDNPYNWSWLLCSEIMDPPTESSTVTSLVERLHYVDVNKTASSWNSHVTDFVLFGLLPYIFRNGPMGTDFSRATRLLSITEYSYLVGCYGNSYSYDSSVSSVQLDIPLQGLTTAFFLSYKPFIRETLTGVAIHYQTASEQASEILKTVEGILIAAALIFATVKIAKFVRRRVALTEIRQGAVDNLSWSMGLNPSTSDINTYLKAKKVLRRTQKFNSLLGLSSIGASISHAVAATDDSQFSAISLVSKLATSNDSAFSTVNSGIGAVSSSLSTVDGKVGDVASSVNTVSRSIGTALDSISAVDSSVSSVSDDTQRIIHVITGE